ncbi:MAG: hypothetical protein EGP80_06200 [Blautia wexlerae]|nr:hypothetical protein [Blautia wexlerae]
MPEHSGARKATGSFNPGGGYNSLDNVPGCVQLNIRRMDREKKIILLSAWPLIIWECHGGLSSGRAATL